jgi:hypothetical protein
MHLVLILPSNKMSFYNNFDIIYDVICHNLTCYSLFKTKRSRITEGRIQIPGYVDRTWVVMNLTNKRFISTIDKRDNDPIGRLTMILYDKRDDVNFSVVIFFHMK